MDNEKLLQVLFDELAKEINNPKFNEIFDPEDLDSMYLLYTYVNSCSDKVIIMTHMMAEIILKERGVIK